MSMQASGSLDLRPTAARVSCQAPALSASATLHTRPPSAQAMKQALTQVWYARSQTQWLDAGAATPSARSTLLAVILAETETQ